MLAGLIFFFAPRKITSRFQFGFAHVFRWPLSVGRSISLSAGPAYSHEDVVDRSKYAQLQNYIATMEMQLEQLRGKYAKLADFRKKMPLDGASFALAYIAKDSATELIVDIGRDDGVTPGQFVLGENSIIGVVSNASSEMARVSLLTDPSLQIPVNVAEHNAILQGDGRGMARISLLPTKYKIKVGDKVFAAPKPGFLTCPIIIGTVTHCKPNDENQLIWDIVVEPACDIERLSSVDVLIMNQPK